MLSCWLSQNFNVPLLLNMPSGSYMNLVSSVLCELMHIVSLAGCATGQVYVVLYCCPGPLVVCVFKRAQEM